MAEFNSKSPVYQGPAPILRGIRFFAPGKSSQNTQTNHSPSDLASYEIARSGGCRTV